MSLVSFVEIRKESQFRQGILKSLDLIQYEFAKNIRNVVIKPNMCYYWDYTTGQTTDPNFVAAVVDVIRSQVSPDIEFSIVESDASAMKCKYAFKMLGYEKMARDNGVALVNLSKDKCQRVGVTVGRHSFYFRVPQTIQNADLRVNIPKIKYMNHVKVTCALKNVYGCNPYPNKFRYHQKLDEVIVALNKAMKFDLCIIDGNIVSGVKPCRLGLVMACQDPVALDVAAAKIAGLNPKSIKHIMLAHREGLGNSSFIPKGIGLNYFKARYPKKETRSKITGLAYNLVVAMGLSQRLGLS